MPTPSKASRPNGLLEISLKPTLLLGSNSADDSTAHFPAYIDAGASPNDGSVVGRDITRQLVGGSYSPMTSRITSIAAEARG
jgi:hypothetical protein